MGVARTEVLPVEEGVGEELGGGGDIGVDEPVVGLPVDPGVGVAEVERVIEQLLAVGAHVEDHGDGPVGVDAPGSAVDDELAFGDGDAAHAPVADAEDRFGVGGHDEVDLVGVEVGGGQ